MAAREKKSFLRLILAVNYCAVAESGLDRVKRAGGRNQRHWSKRLQSGLRIVATHFLLQRCSLCDL